MLNQLPSKNPAVPSFIRRLRPKTGDEGMRLVANDSTLFVQIEHQIDRRVPCLAIARMCLHAAQDGRFGNICVLRSVVHKHNFRVMDLVKRYKHWTGLSLTGFKRRSDCWLDERKKIWVVGAKPNPQARVLTAVNQ